MSARAPASDHRAARTVMLGFVAGPSVALAQLTDGAGSSFETGAGFSAAALSTVIVSLGLFFAALQIWPPS